MREIILTQDQVDTFHRDGYVVVRQLIPKEMVVELVRDYDRAARGEFDVPAWKNRIATGKTLQLGNPSLNIPGWEDHEYRHRIVQIGKELLGEDIDYRYDQLIYKPPHSPVELLWHQDAGYGWPGEANHRSMTCWLALSRATKEMGSLQFIPGSHLEGIAEHIDAQHKSPINKALEVIVDESQAKVVEYEPGDATFHHGRSLHYSSGNSTDEPRRGLSTHLWPSSEID